MKNQSGEPVRVQCETRAGKLRCLVAPDRMRGLGDPLERVELCTAREVDAYDKLIAAGAEIVPAIAEAPPGYARAESGRAFQVKFDLLRRVYIGVSWVPTFQKGDARLSLPPNFPFGRAQAELGMDVSVLSPAGRARHDFKILEGTATFSDLELTGLLFSYDYQHMHRRPAFWISTFLGPPQVFPVTPGIGWGFRLLRVNDRPPAFRDTFDMEIAEAHVSYNPWQSSDLYSHLRLEAGADVGKYWEDRGQVTQSVKTGTWYAGFTGAVKSRFSLGDGGLHYLFMDVTYLRPYMLQGPNLGEAVNRVQASLAYEGIFVAINDQPLSLRLAATGTAQDDPGSSIRNVEARFTAGLRFSFWAPPRVFEPLPEFEEP